MTMAHDVKDFLDRLGEESEQAEQNADPGAPLPEGTRVTRGHNRSRTLQVRLNEDEYEQLELLAKGRELPVSTVARSLLLAALGPSDDAGATLTRIEYDIAQLRRQVNRS
jgi:hypothetical protein